MIASRLYFYYSLSYEQTGDLAEIRGLVVGSSLMCCFRFHCTWFSSTFDFLDSLVYACRNLLALHHSATLRHDELGQVCVCYQMHTACTQYYFIE